MYKGWWWGLAFGLWFGAFGMAVASIVVGEWRGQTRGFLAFVLILGAALACVPWLLTCLDAAPAVIWKWLERGRSNRT